MATFEDRMLDEVADLNANPWLFGRGMVTQEWEEQAVEGVQAIAKLWFNAYSDETKLPRALLDVIDLLNDIYVDTIDLDDDDEDEDEDEDF